MTRCFVVDTSAWIAYFDKNAAFKQLIQENDLKTPALAIAEVSRVFERRRLREAEASRFLDYIARRSVILALDYEQAVKAGRVAEREGLAMADAVIYSYATSEEKLLTCDGHFKGKPNATLVK